MDIPAQLGSGVALFAANAFLPYWLFVVFGVLLIAHGVLLWIGRRQLAAGRPDRAVAYGAAGTIVILVATGWFVPQVLPISALLALWPVALGLPHLGPAARTRLMVVSALATIFVAVASLRVDPYHIESQLPGQLFQWLNTIFVPFYAAAVFLLLRSYSHYIDGTLDLLRHSNRALQESERSLEQKVEERTRELAEKNAQLTSLDDLKSRFVSNASHELRSPLTAIRAFSELLAGQNDINPDTQREFAQIINSEAERLARLADNLLDLSRMESGAAFWQPRPIDPQPVIEAVIKSQEPVAQRKQLALVAELPPQLNWVHADPDALRQVLLNLLTNALKFTTTGQITVSAVQHEDRLRITVSDTGPGIGEIDRAHIFERFYQAGDTMTQKPPGAGLGLAICHEILAHHGSELLLESTPGQGSTFTFELQRTDNAACPQVAD